jgi:hypothetical protein
MTTFDDREKSFEKRFAQEQELQFKAIARRNHLAGLWAAKRLGMTDADAELYAKALVMAELDDPRSDAVFKKLHSDLSSHGVPESEDHIRRMLSDLMAEAITQLNPPSS